MHPIIIRRYNTVFGDLLLGDFQGKLCLCDWYYRKHRERIDQRIQKNLNSSYVSGNSTVLEQTIVQLEEYIQGQRKHFTLPLLPVGTDFQQIVWKTLLQVEYGTTQSYLNLAQMMGNKQAVRAVANANGANAISIIIPCHRIIGHDGSLVSYAGGAGTKKKLLDHEKQCVVSR